MGGGRRALSGGHDEKSSFPRAGRIGSAFRGLGIHSVDFGSRIGLRGGVETGDRSMREAPVWETGFSVTCSEERRRDGFRADARGEVGRGTRSQACSGARTVGLPTTWSRQLAEQAAGAASESRVERTAVDRIDGRRAGRMVLSCAQGSRRTSYAWARNHDSPSRRACWRARVHGLARRWFPGAARLMALEMVEASGRGRQGGPGWDPWGVLGADRLRRI